MKSAHVGDAAARMYADTYSTLAQADAARLEDKAQSTAPVKKRDATSKPVRKSAPSQGGALNHKPTDSPPVSNPVNNHRPLGKFPAVHIDVQVHISPDTSPEQIDRIFESMAKHLGNFTG